MQRGLDTFQICFSWRLCIHLSLLYTKRSFVPLAHPCRNIASNNILRECGRVPDLLLQHPCSLRKAGKEVANTLHAPQLVC